MLRVLERDWNPWYTFERMEREMEEFQKRMAQFFGDLDISGTAGYPPVNIWQNHDGALLYAEVPGLEKEDISVRGSTVTIKGSRRAESPEKDERFHLRERKTGDFTRTIELPYQIEVDKVSARIQNGVLEITLPRAEAEKPRKISLD